MLVQWKKIKNSHASILDIKEQLVTDTCMNKKKDDKLLGTSKIPEFIRKENLSIQI